MLEKIKEKLGNFEKKVNKNATNDHESANPVGPIIVKRPPFSGRYYIYGGKKYLFTHRHPYEQMYWSDETGWVPTDKLKEA